MKIPNSDTIAAISTPPGYGGVAMIRVSGSSSWKICRSLITHNKEVKPRQVIHTWIVDEKGKIDEVNVIFYKAPVSYTGEDMVEITCHGGPVVSRLILELVLSKGAKLAERGEFTKRAFLNGKLDLTRVEAINQIIRASSEKAVRIASRNLSGKLHSTIAGIRDRLLKLLAGMEVGFDYPDDAYTNEELLLSSLNGIVADLAAILQNAKSRIAVSKGIKLVIVGKPNVGKSSLLNALVGEELAIVTDIPGTTRDLITVPLNIEGVGFLLVDTAGIRASSEKIESIGIERAIRAAEEADLILFTLDATIAVDDDDLRILELIKHKRYLVVVNKIDTTDVVDRQKITEVLGKDAQIVTVSALEGSGLEVLKRKIARSVKDVVESSNEDGVFTERQYETLLRCQAHLNSAKKNILQPGFLDAASQDIREALKEIDYLVGANFSSELLDVIFSEFCVGK